MGGQVWEEGYEVGGGDRGVRGRAQAKLAKAVTTPGAEGWGRNGCSVAGEEASIGEARPSPDCLHRQPAKVPLRFWLWCIAMINLHVVIFIEKIIHERREGS